MVSAGVAWAGVGGIEAVTAVPQDGQNFASPSNGVPQLEQKLDIMIPPDRLLLFVI